ncbi:uncharacterized protein LOC113463067 [Phoenix dactylifera]|uniref:Uncharacterized protein LOC113463067 n=1 Tax=Phoenix dactylifera TaxID=42345 RepID=A0A8B9AG85_PHODC|nr:uncharacterized protein LOC113463067 [Phoenix dactylifera]
MSDLESIPELYQLYRKLQSTLADLPENPGCIRLLQLYASHEPEEKGSPENLFDPHQLTSIDSPKGLWCYTPLFYYENTGYQRRKVPVGGGSWIQKAHNNPPGQAWYTQRLEYPIEIHGKTGTSEILRVKFHMKQFTDVQPRPTYALCQIYRRKETQLSASATANEHLGQHTDHRTGAIVHGQQDAMHMVTGNRGTQPNSGGDGTYQLPENIITQTHDSGAIEQLSKGSALDTGEAEQNQLNRYPNSKEKTIARWEWDQFEPTEIERILEMEPFATSQESPCIILAQEDNINIHGDTPGSSIRSFQAQSMRGTSSQISIQNENSTRKRKVDVAVVNFSDGTCRVIEDKGLIEVLKKTKHNTSPPFQSWNAPQERDTVEGQSSMHSHVAEYWTIGLHENDNLQGNNSRYQSYMPSQEGSLINNQNYQQSSFPMDAAPWAGVNLANQRNVQSNDPGYVSDDSSTDQD